MASSRVEVITRAERRRRWSPADKLRLVLATREPGATVAAVAREHGVSESLLYAWRGGLPASGMIASPGATPAGAFVPVAVVDDRPVSMAGPDGASRRCARAMSWWRGNSTGLGAACATWRPPEALSCRTSA